MKFLCVLMLAGSMQIAARGYSQGITVSLKNASLKTLFNEIERQCNFRFVYTREALDKSTPVTINVTNERLERVLKLLFEDQPLTYSIEEKFIVVKIVERNQEAPTTINIKGRVVNENGEAVAGASVMVKGTERGTTTDVDGQFELKEIEESSTILITGVNIEPLEVKAIHRSDWEISVKTKIASQKEIVINAGYYKITDRLKTGDISRVGAATIAEQPVSNPLEALEGRMSGVYIQQTSGVSGSGFNIEIEGRNSLRNTSTNNGNLPLYIVDGVPITSQSLDQNTAIANQIAPLVSPLNFINPSDIESIEVLKDADATAIYGSRGANGVVLITTKKGKPGKTKVDINFYTGVGKITRMMDLLNTQQYLEMRHEAFQNDNSTPQPYDYDVSGVWDTSRYTNWQKKLIGGTSHITSAQASVSGGNQNTQFLFGGGYFREGSVFPGSFADEKGSGHFNLNHVSENKKFASTISVNYVVDHNNLPQADPTSMALFLAPDAPPVYKPDGSLNWANNTWTNPYAAFLKPYQGNTNNLIANSVLSYIVAPGLELKSNFGYNNIQMQERALTPISSQNPSNNPTGVGSFSNQSVGSWIIEPGAEYQKHILAGELTVLIGGTFQENITQAQSFFARGFTNDALIENLSAASTVSPRVFNYAKYKYNAIYGRLNYNLGDEYLINLTARRDGSSRFGPGRQFANFGALGLGWIFSREKFMHRQFSFLSFGKIRMSYGSTGSDQIGDYGYLDTYAPTSSPYNGTSGLTINQLFNPNYGWETNKKAEAAIELGFFNDRILPSISFYRNRSSNQLVGYPLPTITGQSSLPFYNFPATVQNTGWEFELATVNVRSTQFHWTSYFNLTAPRNKLVSYPGIENSSYANTYAVGQPLYIRKAYHFLEVDPQTGLYQFEDVNKDGQISSPNDLLALKKIAKTYYGGFENNLQYKNFQLDFFFQFVKQTGFNYLFAFQPPGTALNQPTLVLQRWQKPGDATDIQRFSQAYGTDPINAYFAVASSDKFISDASFIRLKNLSIAYRLPLKDLSRLRIQNLRIFIQGQNLFTSTKYLGLDPETQSFQDVPPLKIVSAGIQVTL